MLLSLTPNFCLEPVSPCFRSLFSKTEKEKQSDQPGYRCYWNAVLSSNKVGGKPVDIQKQGKRLDSECSQSK